MDSLLLQNFALLNPDAGTLQSGMSLRIQGGRIEEVGRTIGARKGEPVADLGGRTLMPGLIDCHVHICAEGMTSRRPILEALAVGRSAGLLHQMLMRGFTTVRDAGGADAGYREAVRTGVFSGPTLYVSGRPLSQTGGHGDPREAAEYCSCGGNAKYFVIADGVSEVRKAVREEIRRGADQIKVMASGGVSSPTDPIDYVQYSMEELEAIADETRRAGKPFIAHAYTPEAISRAVAVGARSIEHGNFLDDATAAQMAARGTFLVPTLVAYHRVVSHGEILGVPEDRLRKARQVLEQGGRSLEIAHRHGVKIAFGTDLFNAPKEFQSEEFLIRGEVLPKLEVIRSATTVAAELLGIQDSVGRVEAGYAADLVVVDGNPLEDLQCLQEQGRHMPLIIKAGRLIKDLLTRLRPEDTLASPPMSSFPRWEPR
jgi:imidazolonepropionase-like amidohydrolase